MSENDGICAMATKEHERDQRRRFFKISLFFVTVITSNIFLFFFFQRWGEQLLDLRERVIESINQHLWKNDHYSTSPNGSLSFFSPLPAFPVFLIVLFSEDMGDHDSNLMAIAFGVADKQKKDLIWGYLDKAKCLHSPSEVS